LGRSLEDTGRWVAGKATRCSVNVGWLAIGNNVPRGMTLFVVKEVGSIRGAVALSVRIRAAVVWSSTAHGNYGRNAPAAKNVAYQPLLRLVERYVVDKERIEYVLPIKSLHAIHFTDVVGIIGSVFTGSLDKRSSPECLAESVGRLSAQRARC